MQDLKSRLKDLGVSIDYGVDATLGPVIRISAFTRPLLDYTIDIITRHTESEPADINSIVSERSHSAVYRASPGSPLFVALFL